MPRYSLSDDWGDVDDIAEPPHPLGFGSQWGRTWIGLDPPVDPPPGQSTYALDDDEEDEYKFMTRSYPPLSSYLPASSTPVLLKYRVPDVRDDDDDDYYDDDDYDAHEEDDMIVLQQMLQRRSLTTFTATPTKKLQPDSSREIAQFASMERRRMEQEHLALTNEVKNLVLELDRQATARETQQRKQEEEKEAIHRQRKREIRDKEEKEKAIQEQIQAKQEAKAKEEQLRKEDTKRQQAAKTEYVAKAQKLVQQLVAVRQSIEPFDNNKAVSKRRLGMKKIIRGKINTLSENASKIQEVAIEVSQAISEARAEDENIKQALERGDAGYTSDMARGKRYLVDLLASNTIQRVQAEGFNGPRGDGFPLANMLAIISAENKELVPILAAHIYTVCPTAIPTLPISAPDASEEVFMEGLGMLKGKNGEFETFDRFLTRTESIVSLVANIMASSPSSHVLLGGHQGAVDWLTRFLDLLPAPPTSPLPLLTAPVLHGFLAGAGHMLANKHSDTFQKHMQTIVADVLPRLDEGPIGKPSSIRLGKLMDGGFENFRSTLPPKALPELYYGASGFGGGHGGGTSFGAALTSKDVGQSPFGKPSSNPFGNPTGSAPSQPFGTSTTSTASPFGGAPSSNPFGPVSTSIFGTGADGMAAEPSTQSTPFDTAAPSTGSTFGVSSGFGAMGSEASGANTFGGSSTTPFGSTPSPFGSIGASSASTRFGAAPTPFGGASNAAAPSPFGGGSSNPSPFGVPSSSVGGTPFGTSSGASFGGGFGGSNNSSSFGNSGGAGRGSSSGKPPCRFFANGQCKFGSSCKFSHEVGGSGGGGGFGNSGGRGDGGFRNNGSERGGSGRSSSSGRGGFGSSDRGGRGFQGGSSFGGGSSPFSTGFGSSSTTPFGAPRR